MMLYTHAFIFTYVLSNHFVFLLVLTELVKSREETETDTYVLPQKLMEQSLLPKMECIFDQYHKVMASESPEFKVSSGNFLEI